MAKELPKQPARDPRAAESVRRLKALYELSMTLAGDPLEVFERIARMIGELLDVRVVCLSEIRGDELHFLSVYVDGDVVTNAGRCPISITPCATVERAKDIRVYDRVAERFPEASFLAQHGAFAYCGFPSLDNDRNVVAVTCLLDDKPHDFTAEDQELLRAFGQRIGMEIERQKQLRRAKRADAALRQSEARLAGILDVAPAAVITVDRDSRIQLYNNAAETVFGHSAKTTLGQRLEVLLPARFRARHDAHLEEFARAPAATRLMGERSEILGLRADGTEFPAEASISKFDLDGETIFVVMLNDLTERKRTTEALRRRSEALAVLGRIARAANLAVTADDATQVCLDEICAFIGWPIGHARRIAGDDTEAPVATGLWHLDDPDRFAGFRRMAEETRVAPGTGLAGRVLASLKPVWISDIKAEPSPCRAQAADIGIGAGFAFPVVVRSRVVSVLEFYSEHPSEPDEHVMETMVQAGTHLGRVFERHRAEDALRENARALKAKVAELEQAQVELASRSADLMDLAARLRVARDEANAANRAKSEFLATISHELRTPLNAIIGFSEIMKDQMFGPMGVVQYHDYVQDIHGSGRHLLDLVNDILDLSKVESGADELREEIVEVPEVVRSTLTLVRKRAEAADVNVEPDLAGDLPALRVDKRKLTQVLVNLLSNAVKFTDRGGKATLRAWSGQDSGFVFQVIDNGVGIAPEDIPKALSRFGQIDGSLSRKHEGTGIGLPLSKALVEQHGGTLDLQSKIGVGTTVTVRLPAARVLTSRAPARGFDGVAKAG